MPRCVFWASAVLATAVAGAAAPATSLGAAGPPDKVLLIYGGKPVSCRDLTLLTWPQIQHRLRLAARYVNVPPGGIWPRTTAIPFPVRGPLLYYQPQRGAAAAQALRGMCRSYIQSAVDSYLAMKVQSDFTRHHAFNYRTHFYLSRLHAHNLAEARIFDTWNRVYAQCVRRRWTVPQLAAALAKAFPGELRSRTVASAKGWLANERPLRWLMNAVFSCERHGVVAPWCRLNRLPDIGFLFQLRAAIKAGRAKYTKIVARWLGNSGFVVVEHMLPGDEPEVRSIIQSCTGPHGKISRPRLAVVRVCSWLLGSPTAIDPGFGGNYSYFSGLTGLPMRSISPDRFIPLKGKPHSFLFIFQRNPAIKKVLVSMKMSSFLWDVGVAHVIGPSAKRVWAKVRIVAPWLVKPTVKQLVHWGSESGGLPATHLFGFPLPQLVRKKYRLEKW